MTGAVTGTVGERRRCDGSAGAVMGTGGERTCCDGDCERAQAL